MREYDSTVFADMQRSIKIIQEVPGDLRKNRGDVGAKPPPKRGPGAKPPA